MMAVLLLSQGHSKPLKHLSVESCDPSFRETFHFPVSLLDCTTSLPMTVTGYNTTTSLASNPSPTTSIIVKYYNSYESMTASPASRTTASFSTMVTGLNYQKINGSLPSEYLRDPFPQRDSEIQSYVEGQPLSLGDSEILPGTEF